LALLDADLEGRQVFGPYVLHTGQAVQAFEVELGNVWSSHRYGTSAWVEAMRAVLRWTIMEALSDLAIRDGRAMLAAVRARAAVELRPDIGTTRYRLARALRASGQSEEAALEYWHAIQDGPMHGEIWLELLELLRDMGRTTEFRDHLAIVTAIVDACPPNESWRAGLEGLARPDARR
jgi:hypothetical protein